MQVEFSIILISMKQTFFILIVATLFTACNNTMEEAYRMINLTGEDIMVHFTYPNHEVPADINGNTLAKRLIYPLKI